MGQVAIVTGGSSGIGAAAAEYLAAHGCTVYEFSRHEKSGGSASVHHVTADVTDEASVAAAVQSVLDAEGRIDILLNNAGFGISGAAEFTSVEEAKRQLEVNFWGMVRATKAVLPVMRAQRGGRIVNTSSVAAVTPIPFQTYYSVSKAAINSFTMSVGNEVRPYGIRISAVMPGDTRTGFTDARARSFAGDDAYGGGAPRRHVDACFVRFHCPAAFPVFGFYQYTTLYKKRKGLRHIRAGRTLCASPPKNKKPAESGLSALHPVKFLYAVVWPRQSAALSRRASRGKPE